MISNRDYDRIEGTRLITVQPNPDEVLIVLLAKGFKSRVKNLAVTSPIIYISLVLFSIEVIINL